MKMQTAVSEKAAFSAYYEELTRLGNFHRAWGFRGSEAHSAGQFGEDGVHGREISDRQ